MDLQNHLQALWIRWQPEPPEATAHTKSSVTLSWAQEAFQFVSGVIYTVQRREKVPPWVTVYSGSKSEKEINNLAPCSPHRFRVRVTLRASAVQTLADAAIMHYGDGEKAIDTVIDIGQFKVEEKAGGDDEGVETAVDEYVDKNDNGDNAGGLNLKESRKRSSYRIVLSKPWLDSLWSEETCASTDSDGTSATCFGMAVRGGYLKQMQIMLEERPELVSIVNCASGYTPLATAVRKGNVATVKFLLSWGASLEQLSGGERTALHLAALGAHTAVVVLLLDRGADITAQDINEMSVEHYAVDSGDVDTLQTVLARGGSVEVKDGNGWTPLFRAVQGASTELIEILLSAGSAPAAVDRAGLTLAAAAGLLKDDNIARRVDEQYPRRVAAAHFSRLTKKITRVHTIFKL